MRKNLGVLLLGCVCGDAENDEGAEKEEGSLCDVCVLWKKENNRREKKYWGSSFRGWKTPYPQSNNYHCKTVSFYTDILLSSQSPKKWRRRY